VTEAQITALEQGDTPKALFDERERAVFALADQVLDTCRADGETFVAVRQLFSSRQVLEVLLLIGYFRMICSVMTTLELEVGPPFGRKIRDSLQDRHATPPVH
jgi:4-carboxymuconolactone decarboxylase